MGERGVRHDVPSNRDSLSDTEVIQAVSGGDREAFGMLVDRYMQDVHAVAARIVCNAAAADDVAQDTFVRAFQRLYLYDARWSLRNWLMKIATNLSLNHLRSQRRERVLNIRMAEIAPPVAAGRPSEPAHAAADWAYWLDQIDETQRTAIVLFHFHEMPYADIAEVLEVPVNTVRTFLHRGRKRLRELMTAGHDRENGSWNASIPNG